MLFWTFARFMSTLCLGCLASKVASCLGARGPGVRLITGCHANWFKAG